MTDLRSNNEFDSLESFFHERLKDASFAKAEGPWKQIEEELERMEKDKRKRRFFWFFFSGLALLGGMAALWFFVLADQFHANEIAQNKKNVPATISAKQNPENTTSSENPVIDNETAQRSNTVENTEHNQNTNEIISPEQNKTFNPATTENRSSSYSRIQLAACSKKANPSIFRKIPFAVTEVEGKDGIIRYFAETEVNEENLEAIRNVGFASAFVKKNFSTEDNSTTVKEAGMTSNTSAAVNSNEHESVSHDTRVSARNKEKVTESIAMKEPSANDLNTIVATQNNTGQTRHAPTQSLTTADNTNNSIANNTNPPTIITTDTSNTLAPPTTNSVIANNDSSNTNQATHETKADSVPPVAVAETPKDSIAKKIETKDSSKTAVAQVTPPPFTPEWAILILAGPNIFTSHAESNLYQTSGETQPTSLNTELKIQYRPMKLVSFSGGINYTTYSTKQDRTFFRFNKYQSSDYVFYSAFGPMAAPMSTLLEGYSMQAPFDTFPCYYSQSSKLNMINIPLEANVHLLNKSRISVYFGLGANSSFVLSQHSTLTLHKEHFDNTISYNNVTVSPFSLSLLFSLGCDVRLGKRLYLSFVPSYRYGVTNMSNTSGTTFSPTYFSGNAGLKFKL